MDKVIDTVLNKSAAHLKDVLQNGGDVNASENQINALLWAVTINDLEKVKTLLEFGADVTSNSPDGETPLIRAAYQGSLEIVEALLHANAIVNASDDIGQTALMAAAKIGSLEIVRLLVENGANIMHTDKQNRTVLHWSIIGGDFPDVVQYLVNAGINVNINNNHGETAIDYAKQLSRNQALNILLT